jgi:hypothetical protein
MQQSHQNLSNGLQSFADVSPDYELAPVGIGSIKDQAEKLAEYGRNGDIYIVHAAEGETVVPMEVLDANPKVRELLFGQMRDMGLDPQEFVVGSELNSINPSTGMPEFFFKKIFRAVKKAVKGVVNIVKKAAPVVLPIAASAFGIPFLGPMFGAGTIGAGFVGGVAGGLAGGNSLKDSLKSGLLSGGIAGLAGGLSGAFSPSPHSSFLGGLKGSFTGATPVFSDAGRQIGTQYAASPYALGSSPGAQASAAASKAQMSALGSGDFGRAFMGEGTLLGDTPTNVYNPEGVIKPGFTAEGFQELSSLKPDMVSSTGGSALGGSGTDTLGTVGRKAKQLSPFAEASVESGGKTYYGTAAEDIIRKAAQEKIYSAAAAKNIPNDIVFDAAIKAGEDAVKAAQPDMLQKWGTTAALAGGAAAALGVFDPPPPEDDPDESQLPGYGKPVGSELYAQDPGKYQVAQLYSDEVAKRLGLNYNYDPSQTQLVPVAQAAKGGIMSFPRRETLVRGPGTERSDDIPAMLSDGEFVMTAKAVRGASPNPTGNSERDRRNGAKNMYAMMRNFEMRA